MSHCQISNNPKNVKNKRKMSYEHQNLNENELLFPNKNNQNRSLIEEGTDHI